MPVETVNLNLWPKCDLKCRYCYGRYPHRPVSLNGDRWKEIISLLSEEGVRRVTFSGGEPTLHPDLLVLLHHARSVGLQTSIVTNGARLSDEMIALLDLVGMTLDSDEPEVLIQLGRTTAAGGDYLSRFLDVAGRVRGAGVMLKINSVVTRLNLAADLVPILLALEPVKWKPLQFTTIVGENHEDADDLRITRQEFDGFVDRHRAPLEAAGIWVQPEDEQTVSSTYVMIDPSGIIYQTSSGMKRYSDPVLEVGLRRAMAQAGGYDRRGFEGRGGHVDVRRLPIFVGGPSES